MLPSTLENLRDAQKTWLLPLGELIVWGADNSQSEQREQQRLKAIPRPPQPMWAESLWNGSTQDRSVANSFGLRKFLTPILVKRTDLVDS